MTNTEKITKAINEKCLNKNAIISYNYCPKVLLIHDESDGYFIKTTNNNWIKFGFSHINMIAGLKCINSSLLD